MILKMSIRFKYLFQLISMVSDLDKAVDSGSTDAGSIPVRDAKVDISGLLGLEISLFLS